MNGDIELLLKLQNIDYDLGELERSKEYVPDMMENLRKEITDTEGKLVSLGEQLTHAKLEQKDIELEDASRQEKFKELQQRMMNIKTNKEYDALVSEIDQIKERLTELESRGLELLEIIEISEKELEAISDKAKTIKSVNDEQIANLQTQIDSVGTKIKDRTTERDDIAGQVGKRAKSIYERIRRGKSGAAVVAVRKRACGACFKSLPPQRIQEIKLGGSIITCDSCGRMLVWLDISNN